MFAICSFFMCLSEAPAQTQRDSAGVRISENATPSWSAQTAWHIAPVPAVDIGGAARDSLDELSDVRGAGRLRDGRIAVANGATRTIRLYDARGRFAGSFGGRGNGPGEFQDIARLVVLGETLVVLNVPAPPLMDALYFNSRGGFIGKAAVFTQAQPAISPEFFPDGRAVAFYLNVSRATPNVSDARWTDSLRLVVLNPAANRVDSLKKFPWLAKRANPAFATGAAVTFGPRARLAVARDGFYAGFPDHYSIGFYDRTGRLQRLVRKTSAVRPVPAGAANTFKAKYDEFNVIPSVVQGTARRQMEAMRAEYLKALTFAEYLPSFGDLMVDKTGHLWVQRYEVQHGLLACKGLSCIPTYDAPTLWDVFDATGRWLGPVTMPGRFAPLEIGADYVVGLFRDEDDVEHVRQYAITKPAPR